MSDLDLDFHPAKYPREALNYQTYMTKLSVNKARAKQIVRKIQSERVLKSATHQVAVNKFLAPAPFGEGTWLSIKRLDREIIAEREVLARIMRSILPDHSGFELFPSPKRLVDTANQYHLWVFSPETIEPFRATPLGPAQALNGDVELRPMEFEGTDQRVLGAISLGGRNDWREIFDYKERIVPGCEAALFLDREEGHHLDGMLLCFTDVGYCFPFGFKERQVMGAEEAASLVGAKQRDFEKRPESPSTART